MIDQTKLLFSKWEMGLLFSSTDNHAINANTLKS